MLILRVLCRRFPSLRILWVGIGYLFLFVGVAVWFLCFPLTAYTLHVAHQFPLAYFGILTSEFPAIDFYLPYEMRPVLAGVCAAFTFFGLFTIYFNVRNLIRLWREGNGKRSTSVGLEE